MIGTAPYTVEGQQAARQARLLALALGATVIAGLCGLLLAMGKETYALAIVIGLLGTALLVWRPAIGLYVVFAATVAIDQYDMAGFRLPSSRLPLWRALDTTTGIPLRFYPVELILLAALSLLVLQRIHRGERPILRLGRLAFPCAALLVVLAYGLARGMAHQDIQAAYPFYLPAAIAEVRPFVYLPLLYLFAHNAVRSRRQLRVITWIAIAAVAFKTLQLTWLIAQLGPSTFQLNQIANHEDSLFLSSVLPLAAALWLYGGPRRQRWTLLALAPLLLLVLIANQRRAGFIALGVALLVVWAIVVMDRAYRKRVLIGTAILGLLTASYAATFWESRSPLAIPLVAFRSVYDEQGFGESDNGYKTTKNLNSNLWRKIENANIRLTIGRSPVLGLGFGQRYFMWIEEISIDFSGFTYWRYINHNTIYWLWTKVGALGFGVFWYLIGSSVILCCLVFRRGRDAEYRAVALTTVGLVVMLVIFAYGDLILNSEKTEAYLGAWLGVLASLDRLVSAPAGHQTG